MASTLPTPEYEFPPVFAIESAYNTFMRAMPGGEGALVDLQPTVGNWETFTAERFTDNTFAIRTFHNTYLRAHNDKEGEGSTLDQQEHVGPFEKFVVTPDEDGRVSFCSFHGTFIRAHHSGQVDMQVHARLREKFRIVPCGRTAATPVVEMPQVFALKSCHGTYLRAYPGGTGAKVDAQAALGEWEQFTRSSFDSRTFAIMTAHGTFLRAHDNGEGSLLDQTTHAGLFERFTIVPFEDGRIALCSAHGSYICVHPGRANARVTLEEATFVVHGGAAAPSRSQSSTADGTAPYSEWERLEVVPCVEQALSQPPPLPPTFALRSCHGTYLRATPGGNGAAVDWQPRVGDWERFGPHAQQDGTVALQTHHGTYLRAHGGVGAAVDQTMHVGPFERFTVERQEDGRVALRSPHGTYLSAPVPQAGEAAAKLQDSAGECEVFQVIALDDGGPMAHAPIHPITGAVRKSPVTVYPARPRTPEAIARQDSSLVHAPVARFSSISIDPSPEADVILGLDLGCARCTRAAASVVVLPCRHLACCDECARTLFHARGDCPLCHVQIQEMQHI